MDPINNITPVAIPVSIPAPAAPVIQAPVQSSQPVVPVPSGAGVAGVQHQQAAKTAEDITGSYVPNAQAVVFFKGSDGHYITRIRDVNTGVVKYIPELPMPRIGGGAPAVTLQA